MSAPAVPEVIEIAKISCYLAAAEVNEGKLYGAQIEKRLPQVLYTERKTVEWLYLANPNDTTLTHTAAYLLSLCGKYAPKAQYIMSGVGGGMVGVSGFSITPYIIDFTSSDFADATHYNNADLVGKTVKIFWNDIARFLYEGTEWVHTATGIQILVDGFDATLNEYNLVAFIEANVNTATINAPITVTMTGQTGTYVAPSDMLLRTLVIKVTNTQNVIIGNALGGSEYFTDEVVANVPYENTINTFVPAGTTIYFERDAVTPLETWTVLLYIN